MTALLALVLVGSGLLIALDKLTPAEARELLPLVLTPLFTLFGAVVAFFFKPG
jgi:hypothetical protein